MSTNAVNVDQAEPPALITKKLEDLALNTGRIIRDFDDMLKEPDLVQLTIAFNIVSYYRKQYLDLQAEAIPGHEGRTKLKEFLDANLSLVTQHPARAKETFQKTIKTKDDWNDAIHVLRIVIDEFQEQIADLVDRKQKSGLIDKLIRMKGCLEGLIPFTETIALHLNEISRIWSEIYWALAKVDNLYKVMASVTGHMLFDKVRPQVIKEWEIVRDESTRYIWIVGT